MAADIRATIDAAALQPGGATASVLGLPDGARIGGWINPKPVGVEHAMGFRQLLPSTWRTDAAAAPGRPRDPYCSVDAMVVASSYLHRIEVGALGGRQHDLPGVLALYGSTAYATRVLALAEPAVTTSNLPVVLPIPAPGWVQRISTLAWPADLAAHMSPAAATNQCVVGALATLGWRPQSTLVTTPIPANLRPPKVQTISPVLRSAVVWTGAPTKAGVLLNRTAP